MLVLVWHIVGTTPRTLLTYFSTSVPYIILILWNCQQNSPE